MENLFKLAPLVTLLRQTAIVEVHYAKDQSPASEDLLKVLCDALSGALVPLENLKMRASFIMALDFRTAIERRENTPEDRFSGSDIAQRSFAVFKTLQTECELVVCRRMDLSRKGVCDELNPLVQTRFATAIAELREAENCLLFDSGTACVFHSMRAIEVVVRAVWKTLGIPAPKLFNSWGELIGPMEKELAKKPQDRIPAWNTDAALFHKLTLDLRAIQKSWRDSTMHIQSSYGEKEALKILTFSAGALEDAARRLDQDGTIHPAT